MGKHFTVNEDLKTAFAGKMVANFDKVDDVESECRTRERQAASGDL